jgi:tetratricopeptide (TPR) repeat protein
VARTAAGRCSRAALAGGAGEAATWDSLGYIHHRLGNHERAAECYGRSADLYRELADRFNEADTLDHLGDVLDSAGDVGAARCTWARALRILDELGHPGAGQVRAELRQAGAGMAPGGRDQGPRQQTRVVSVRLHGRTGCSRASLAPFRFSGASAPPSDPCRTGGVILVTGARSGQGRGHRVA